MGRSSVASPRASVANEPSGAARADAVGKRFLRHPVRRGDRRRQQRERAGAERRRRSVGQRHGQKQLLRQADDLLVRANKVEVQRLGGNPNIEPAWLRPIGRGVRQVGREVEILVLVAGAGGDIVRFVRAQRNVCAKVALRVEIAFHQRRRRDVVSPCLRVPLALVIPHHAHVPVQHGLAEKIVRVNQHVGVLARQVERAVRCWRDGEGRQIVLADPDRRLGFFAVFRRGLDAVLPKPEPAGNLPIRSRNAVLRRRCLGPIEQRIVGVAELERQGQSGPRMLRAVQRQQPRVQRLARLVERLVGRQLQRLAAGNLQRDGGILREIAEVSCDRCVDRVKLRAWRRRKAESGKALGVRGDDLPAELDLILVVLEVC